MLPTTADWGHLAVLPDVGGAGAGGVVVVVLVVVVAVAVGVADDDCARRHGAHCSAVRPVARSSRIAPDGARFGCAGERSRGAR